MAEVVREGDGFGEVFVELEWAGDVSRDSGDFDGVSQARAQVIAVPLRKTWFYIRGGERP